MKELAFALLHSSVARSVAGCVPLIIMNRLGCFEMDGGLRRTDFVTTLFGTETIPTPFARTEHDVSWIEGEFLNG